MSETFAGFEVIRRHLEHGPRVQAPKRIIVHSMGYKVRVSEDNTLYAASFLNRQGYSAHMLVAPDGTPIRCRDDDEGAYHALDHNTDSLGIEILVPGEHNYSTFLEAIETEWTTPEQWNTAVEVVAYWCERWAIGTTPGQLDRHSDVDPERKSDPGAGFDWETFLADVRAKL